MIHHAIWFPWRKRGIIGNHKAHNDHHLALSLAAALIEANCGCKQRTACFYIQSPAVSHITQQPLMASDRRTQLHPQALCCLSTLQEWMQSTRRCFCQTATHRAPEQSASVLMKQLTLCQALEPTVFSSTGPSTINDRVSFGIANTKTKKKAHKKQHNKTVQWARNKG